MEQWRMVWRERVAPILPLAGLVALADGLREKSYELMQGQSVFPECQNDSIPPFRACAIGYALWKSSANPKAVSAKHLSDMTWSFLGFAGKGLPGGCGDFVAWWDSGWRDLVMDELLPEVEMAIQKRKKICECLGLSG